MSKLVRFFLLTAFLTTPFLMGTDMKSLYQQDSAEIILDNMTPEERIGQLFLVTFDGSRLEDEDPIISLIRDHHIAGVLLAAENDNFVDSPDTLEDARQLIDSLQQIEISSSFSIDETDASESELPTYIPLFIAIEQEGDGPPYSSIHSALTELPSQMALGATWEPSSAFEAGRILGSELDALGINMVFGPSLDVLEDPRLGGPGDLGVRTFGGDPYWVSEFGKSFIEGVHDGGNDRVAAISKHFPGHGGSDRPLNEEVATVRKTLDQLQQIELTPFFQVTSALPGAEAHIADGLLASHIRYQGLQGNIRATTRPISLDRDAFDLLLSLGNLPDWREGGGVMVSDSLGSRAVRRFHDPSETSFISHLVARDAFLAGNDLLLLADFQSSEEEDEFSSIVATLNFFAQKYREDSVFADRVDESVLRILNLKMRLNEGDFDNARSVFDSSSLEGVGSSTTFGFDIAQEGATLLSPSGLELAEGLGAAPQIGDRIVFFTDERLFTQCSTCEPQVLPNRRALEDAVLTLYGTGAAGQVGEWNLTSFSTADLAGFLGESPSVAPPIAILPPEEIEEPLLAADWLIFSILREEPDVFGSNALQTLLDQRPDLAREKRIVVFAHEVPYVLDATQISDIEQFFGLYSKTPDFIDVAARLLFQELSAQGASPVGVPGIAYDLIEQTSSDPAQLITLSIRQQFTGLTPEADTGGFSIGDAIVLETGIILDRNSNHVPDGTPVEFLLNSQSGSGLQQSTIAATTEQGAARVPLILEQPGLFSIQAQSGEAIVSEILQIDVQEGVEAFVTVIAPTPAPTQLGPFTPTSPFETATPDITEDGEAGIPEDELPQMGFVELMLGIVGVAVIATGGYWTGRNEGKRNAKIVRAMWILTFGALLGYNYLALGLPGSTALMESVGVLSGFTAAVIGGLLTWIALQFWYRIR